jgi:hypothetical protein
MSDEFYCILKLVSGEEILSLISVDDNDNDPMIILQNPITVRLVHNYAGAHIKVKPWMDLSNDDIFMLRLDKVMTMSETTDEKLIEIYNNYIKEEMEEEDSIDTYKSSTDELNGSVKPSSKMGYLSTVEEARVALEDLYKLEDNKES